MVSDPGWVIEANMFSGLHFSMILIVILEMVCRVRQVSR
jgi:hypothetical protein